MNNSPVQCINPTNSLMTDSAVSIISIYISTAIHMVMLWWKS